jgi:hypothetical protein
MQGNFLLYGVAFQLANYSTFYDKIETLSRIIEKARSENLDEFFKSSNLEYTQLVENIELYQLTYVSNEEDLLLKKEYHK